MERNIHALKAPQKRWNRRGEGTHTLTTNGTCGNAILRGNMDRNTDTHKHTNTHAPAHVEDAIHRGDVGQESIAQTLP
jgi:hypothetical protein